jgi:hypothetical protein
MVQDEFDIQFGMDVTLWVLPANVAVAVPVSGERVDDEPAGGL